MNLSQLTDPSELDTYFCQGASDDRSARFFFFDEFDTSLDNVPLGWLRWFLAPMQDGEFFTKGKKVAIGKAVFVFAGGTAASRDEFEQRASLDEASYRALKVPDFMSRLRAFMDIQGVNNFDDERAVRRALILKYNLKRWEDKRQNGQFPLDPGLRAQHPVRRAFRPRRAIDRSADRHVGARRQSQDAAAAS